MSQRVGLSIIVLGVLPCAGMGACAGGGDENAFPSGSGRVLTPKHDGGSMPDTATPSREAGGGIPPVREGGAAFVDDDADEPPPELPPTDENTFGIFSDSVKEDVTWGTHCKLDTWTSNQAGATAVVDSTGLGVGPRALRIVGTGQWMGIGIRAEPKTQARDLRPHTRLHFMVKGPTGRQYRIGMTDASGREVWMTPSAGVAKLDGSWRTVQVPIAQMPPRAPSTGILDSSQVVQFFMFATDSTLGYEPGDTFYLDEIFLLE